ncbi:amino acid permease [Clostridium sp. CCUG 7971]|uniref:APC family permease n=1 Tax=Clostridium sp. CCUG 7971 TaxID=2811414 RepID=UPI001ABBCE43|nr:amino acid permease [Clostridium sp. CCUG 7971]MBO3444680.1 amino acid permease [Clostridium sp. CCUG 7971]
MSQNANQQKLRKTIGFSAALSTVVGMLIGSGVFFKPQAIYSATNGGPGLGLLAWLIGGLVTIAAGLTAAEVSSSIIKPGGLMVYLEEIYGERIGFLTGWMQTILFIPAIAAALGIIFAQEAVSMMGLNSKYVIIIAVSVIVFIAALNSLGAKFGGSIQTISTVCKLLPLAIIIIFGFTKGDSSSQIITPFVGEGVNVVSAISQVLIATLFAYDGWIYVGALAGEMKNPSKHLPMAIVGGISIVMAVYLMINVAYLFVIPASEMAPVGAAPATLVAQKLFGASGAKIISVGVLISVFGTLNGFILTGGRIPYMMGYEKKIPLSNVFSKLNNNGVPLNGTWLIAGLAILYSLTGQFNLLSDLAIFTIWIFYTMLFVGVMKLRKTKPNMKRPYKVPLYPIIPMIATIGGIFVVISTIITQPQNAISGLIITIIGLPVYEYMKKKNSKSRRETIA